MEVNITIPPGSAPTKDQNSVAVNIVDPSEIYDGTDEEEDDDGYDSSSSLSSSRPSSSQENHDPFLMEPYQFMGPGKRAGSQPLPPLSKRSKHDLEQFERKALEHKLFKGKGLSVLDFDTFTSPEDRLADQISASQDVEIAKEELQKLIESIPLEDEGDKADIHEIILVIRRMLLN